MDNIESTNLQTHESEEKETKDSKTEEERSRVLVSDCLSLSDQILLPSPL